MEKEFCRRLNELFTKIYYTKISVYLLAEEWVELDRDLEEHGWTLVGCPLPRRKDHAKCSS